MHAGQPRNRAVELTSSQCSLLHVTKSGSMHKLLGLGLMHTCPSGWRSRLPAAVTGHASPECGETGAGLHMHTSRPLSLENVLSLVQTIQSEKAESFRGTW